MAVRETPVHKSPYIMILYQQRYISYSIMHTANGNTFTVSTTLKLKLFTTNSL